MGQAESADRLPAGLRTDLGDADVPDRCAAALLRRSGELIAELADLLDRARGDPAWSERVRGWKRMRTFVEARDGVHADPDVDPGDRDRVVRALQRRVDALRHRYGFGPDRPRHDGYDAAYSRAVWRFAADGLAAFPAGAADLNAQRPDCAQRDVLRLLVVVLRWVDAHALLNVRLAAVGAVDWPLRARMLARRGAGGDTRAVAARLQADAMRLIADARRLARGDTDRADADDIDDRWGAWRENNVATGVIGADHVDDGGRVVRGLTGAELRRAVHVYNLSPEGLLRRQQWWRPPPDGGPEDPDREALIRDVEAVLRDPPPVRTPADTVDKALRLARMSEGDDVVDVVSGKLHYAGTRETWDRWLFGDLTVSEVRRTLLGVHTDKCHHGDGLPEALCRRAFRILHNAVTLHVAAAARR